MSHSRWHNRWYHLNPAHDVRSPCADFWYLKICIQKKQSFTLHLVHTSVTYWGKTMVSTWGKWPEQVQILLLVDIVCITDKLESTLNLLIAAFIHLGAADILLAEVRLWCCSTPTMWHMPSRCCHGIIKTDFHYTGCIPEPESTFFLTPCVRSSALH